MIVTANLSVYRTMAACEDCGHCPSDPHATVCSIGCGGHVSPSEVEVPLALTSYIDSHDARRAVWSDFEVEAAMNGDRNYSRELSSEENYRACKALLEALREAQMESEVENHG